MLRQTNLSAMRRTGRGGKFAALVGLTISAAVLATGGCGLSDALQQFSDPLKSAVDGINLAIHNLSITGSSFQQIMQDLISNLPAAENDIKQDVTDVLDRAIGGATTDLIATTDFFNRRMTEGLQEILARLLNQPFVPQPPAFLNFVPDTVDLLRVPNELNAFTIFGYDFDRKDPQGKTMQLMLVKTGHLIIDQSFVEASRLPQATLPSIFHIIRAGTVETKNVTSALALATHYKAIVNLGANGVPLDDDSNQLQLVWNNEIIGALPIIQPPPIAPHDIDVGLASITYTPPRIEGDREFDGNGPAVFLRAEIAMGQNTVIGRVFMRARETEDDWTTAQGWSPWKVVFTPPPGVQIQNILSPTSTEISYVDRNHSVDQLIPGQSDLVNHFDVVGDSEGDDAGIQTNVNVIFNNARLRVLGG